MPLPKPEECPDAGKEAENRDLRAAACPNTECRARKEWEMRQPCLAEQNHLSQPLIESSRKFTAEAKKRTRKLEDAALFQKRPVSRLRQSSDGEDGKRSKAKERVRVNDGDFVQVEPGTLPAQPSPKDKGKQRTVMDHGQPPLSFKPTAQSETDEHLQEGTRWGIYAHEHHCPWADPNPDVQRSAETFMVLAWAEHDRPQPESQRRQRKPPNFVLPTNEMEAKQPKVRSDCAILSSSEPSPPPHRRRRRYDQNGQRLDVSVNSRRDENAGRIEDARRKENTASCTVFTCMDETPRPRQQRLRYGWPCEIPVDAKRDANARQSKNDGRESKADSAILSSSLSTIRPK
jgi:hypothetical protein